MPIGWRIASLEDVLQALPYGGKVQQGWSPQCDKEPAGAEEWGVLKTTAIQAGAFVDHHHKRLPKHFEPRSALEVRNGDLLLTNAGPRARCAVPCLVRSTRSRLMLSGKIYRFRADENVMDPRFLEYFLLAPATQQLLDRMKTGISDSGLNLTRARFLGLPVPVPPLDEQRRIVELLEDHLSRLDAAQEQLMAAVGKTEVLTLAASVGAMRRFMTSGHEIPFGNRLLAVPTSWSSCQLIEVASLVEYGTSAKTQDKTNESSVAVLRMGNLKHGSLDLAKLKYLPLSHPDFPKLLLQSGDLLFNRTNSAELVGKAAVWRGELASAAFASYLIRVRFTADVLPEWASIVINSLYGRAYVASVVSQQVGQANVNGSKLKAFPMPLPPLAVQHELVARYEGIVAGRDRLTASAARQNGHAHALRRGLLAAAVSGQLTASQSRDDIRV